MSEHARARSRSRRCRAQAAGQLIEQVGERTSELRRHTDPQAAVVHAIRIEWLSIYTFQCRRLLQFRHGRVLFAGDAAHQVSPFGARGANSGMQDTDNLCWKLALVIGGGAPDSLLDSYDAERGYAPDENIANSTRSTDFMTPSGRRFLRAPRGGPARPHRDPKSRVVHAPRAATRQSHRRPPGLARSHLRRS